MEFIGPAPLGPFAALAAEMPLRKASDVKKVKPGAKTGDTTADARQNQAQDARSAEARDIAALRREMERRDLPTGPPPSFQMSLLEVEADILHVIARVEAARTQAREADALKADALAEQRSPEAEMVDIPVVGKSAGADHSRPQISVDAGPGTLALSATD